MAKAADVMLILNEACSSGEYNFSFHDFSATKMASLSVARFATCAASCLAVPQPFVTAAFF